MNTFVRGKLRPVSQVFLAGRKSTLQLGKGTIYPFSHNIFEVVIFKKANYFTRKQRKPYGIQVNDNLCTV